MANVLDCALLTNCLAIASCSRAFFLLCEKILFTIVISYRSHTTYSLTHNAATLVDLH